ncbi:MAG: M23 family metallopeptidase [Candidatus Limnocylindria bacterium]
MVIGLLAIASAGGIVSARQQAPNVADADSALAAQAFPFSLVALAHAAESTEPPITQLSLVLDPQTYQPPLDRQQSGVIDRLIPSDDPEPTGPPATDSNPEAAVGNVEPNTVPVAPEPAEVAPVSIPVLSWPVAGGGSITQYFYAGHLGIDIAAPWGNTVLAANDGLVTYAGWKDNGGGYVIDVTHFDGLVTSYNHLGGIWVAPGQAVARGEAIGAVGCTGLCTGPHLHFAVVTGGVAVNPLRYL